MVCFAIGNSTDDKLIAVKAVYLSVNAYATIQTVGYAINADSASVNAVDIITDSHIIVYNRISDPIIKKFISIDANDTAVKAINSTADIDFRTINGIYIISDLNLAIYYRATNIIDPKLTAIKAIDISINADISIQTVDSTINADSAAIYTDFSTISMELSGEYLYLSPVPIVRTALPLKVQSSEE